MSRQAGFEAALENIPRFDAPASVRIKSRDLFWFSPILRKELDGSVADLVVCPRSLDEVIRVAAAAAAFRMPVTVRGGGTGCCGQAVPLAGGVVLDLAALDGILRADGDTALVEAGATLLEIDRALKPLRRELRHHPSARKAATIGGFVAAGGAGVGSCTWGGMGEPGSVLSVEIVTLEEEPRVLTLAGEDALAVVGGCGCNGIITKVEVPLALRRAWAERILTFPSLAQAAGFGQALLQDAAIARKLVSVHDRGIAGLVAPLAGRVPAERAMALVMVDEGDVGATMELAASFEGALAFARSAEGADNAAFCAIGGMAPVYEFAWQHTTLHALRLDPALTHLQFRLPDGDVREHVAAIAEAFGDEMRLHLEFLRRHGEPACVALPLLRYAGRDRLYRIIAELEAMGAAVCDPHDYRIPGPVPARMAETDPHGLLNPGKFGDVCREDGARAAAG